ncbi:hypothetical protein ACHAQA_002659 [Verticillium albo-atrum]
MSGNFFQPLQSPMVERPPPNPLGSATSAPAVPGSQPTTRKKKRTGKKKRGRRKSFAVLPEESHDEAEASTTTPAGRPDFYLQTRNFSNASLDSQALLDHRDQQPLRPRRGSTMVTPGSFQTPPTSRLRVSHALGGESGEDGEPSWDENAPLLSRSAQRTNTMPALSYGAGTSQSRPRVSRRGSSRSSRQRQPVFNSINYPPSMPGSPRIGGSDPLDLTFGDVMITDELDARLGRSPHDDYRLDDQHSDHDVRMEGSSPGMARRKTIALQAEADVCFPSGVSELGEEEHLESNSMRRPRRRRAAWPDLTILDEWSRIEKEGRSEERRVKRITEPQLINGRLRTVHRGWMRPEEDSPYRFTYFNEEFQSTIHSQTISELVQVGGSFQELFIPEPRVLSDDSDDDEDDAEDISMMTATQHHHPSNGMNGLSGPSTRQGSAAPTPTQISEEPESISPGQEKMSHESSRVPSGKATPTRVKSPTPNVPQPEPAPKQPRFGERPVWWLDVLCPTEAEMKVLSKAFGIHPLTAEDIMVQEAREKVELFRHYYFVNYRSFDQDSESEDYLEPVNMYVIVFREGVLSFHFSMTPHSANVRRRIRQLKDFVIVNSDWISYAIIDDITDVFGPLIQNIEDEVDDIDDAILRLHSSGETKEESPYSEKDSDDGHPLKKESHMLLRVGDCRKRVMSLYRLLGNKADVIKGFAKRCNERWEVAPRSDIGLYLGDIQDHIVTMTSNLSHYEKILARSHGNYLAQINIRMNERSEQTADVLGKLTVLGTIVLPMNIITGLWGMNVWVPGQEDEGDLTWFWCLTAGLLAFGLTCFIVAKRVYNIV